VNSLREGSPADLFWLLSVDEVEVAEKGKRFIPPEEAGYEGNRLLESKYSRIIVTSFHRSDEMSSQLIESGVSENLELQNNHFVFEQVTLNLERTPIFGVRRATLIVNRQSG
jgi:hypothetical protein